MGCTPHDDPITGLINRLNQRRTRCTIAFSPRNISSQSNQVVSNCSSHQDYVYKCQTMTKCYFYNAVVFTETRVPCTVRRTSRFQDIAALFIWVNFTLEKSRTFSHQVIVFTRRGCVSRRDDCNLHFSIPFCGSRIISGSSIFAVMSLAIAT
jgi:hypothetical protein